MYIERLELNNFRNYTELNLAFPKGMNIVLGDNAQGKSSIVEAIYLLATSKSYRTSKDTDMIMIDQPFCRASAKIIKSNSADIEPAIVISRTDKKKVTVNGVSYQKIGDMIGKINAVIFSSNDLEMIRGEPSQRRRFLNLEIAQISPKYIHSLARYKRTLQQRNILIKSFNGSFANKNMLSDWNVQLASYGAVISKSRAVFIDGLSKRASEIYSSLSDKDEQLSFRYRCGYTSADILGKKEDEIRDIFIKETEQTSLEDIRRGITTRGVHRDDITISISGLNVRSYASQGQVRTAAIASKIAEMELLTKYTGDKPIMLLDDIMAELDEGRRKNILEIAKNWDQTVITSASCEDLDVKMADMVLKVENGHAERVS